jgi:TRAP-type C4-dicarboxylate transport system permease small subunit
MAHFVSGAILVFMITITMMDVILRYFGRPIFGAYELISLSGGFVVGFAIPYTTWKRGHVYVDSIINSFSKERREVMNVTTRCLSILLFFLMGWNFILMGTNFYVKHEVTASLHVPYYPVAYGIGISCFIQCILLFSDILKIVGGEYE